jgi:chromosome segregation ATPase
MSVSRQKYDKAKEAARSWHEALEDSKEKVDELEGDVEDLKQAVVDLKEYNTRLLSEVNRWKKCSEELPDTELVDELETENKNMRRQIRSLKKEIRSVEEKFKDRIAKLEREKLLSDGKIQQLEEARKDLKERYSELKQDYREQQRWSRGMTSRAE